MENGSFDRLAKRIAGAKSRRELLVGLAKGLAAIVGVGRPVSTVLWPHSGDAASCRAGGVSCAADGQCCSGECGEPNPRGRRTCTCTGEQVMCGLRCCDEGMDCVDGECRALCEGGGACTVFITDSSFQSIFGSAQAADAVCQDAATNAGLAGTYRAWLSDANSSPSPRFARASGPYVRVDGLQVAANWAGLTDGTLQNPINISESGGTVNSFVWTATDLAGALVGSTPCGNWTSRESLEEALLGASASTNVGWTGDGSARGSCFNSLPLYCFQQSA
jgi:hypothetical protein